MKERQGPDPKWYRANAANPVLAQKWRDVRSVKLAIRWPKEEDRASPCVVLAAEVARNTALLTTHQSTNQRAESGQGNDDEDGARKGFATQFISAPGKAQIVGPC